MSKSARNGYVNLTNPSKFKLDEPVIYVGRVEQYQGAMGVVYDIYGKYNIVVDIGDERLIVADDHLVSIDVYESKLWRVLE